MPRGDGMGPAGMGPMTGRAAGYCNGSTTPGFASPGAAGGFGRGRRAGRGWGGRGRAGRWGDGGWGGRGGGGRGGGWGGGGWAGGYRDAYAPAVNPDLAPYDTPAQDAEMLKRQAKAVRQTLDRLEAQIDALEAKEPKEA